MIASRSSSGEPAAGPARTEPQIHLDVPRWPREPLVLTELEAAQLLRLIDDAVDADAARRRMNRLVDQGKLRPAVIGNKRRYALEELRRFVRDETERYGEAR